MPKPGKTPPAAGERPARDSAATRLRILEVAKERFSQAGYDQVGVREIAAAAAADPALVIRYFGSKEDLFREIADTAFSAEAFLDGGAPALAESVAAHLTGDLDQGQWRSGYDPFRLLLCSIGSPVAGPIISACFDQSFLQPLARALKGRERRQRSVMLAAQILGFALVRLILAEQDGGDLSGGGARELLRKGLAACVQADAS